ncbi:hypothetical protein B0H11DRAFT_260176 [Mycena galericulata]|nr:hypothetical protein B0H11DRAFT_260176 [Mycena galericulata]
MAVPLLFTDPPDSSKIQRDFTPRLRSRIPRVAGGAIMDVPPELWAVVAKLCDRQALVQLCAVSHTFYVIFSPLLYGTRTTTPPLTGAQAERLIETLGAERTPHPGPLVRRLAFPSHSSYFRQIDGQTYLAALRRLFDPPRGGHPVRPAALCALEWDLPDESLAEALGSLLRTPGCFPNLKEIIVQCPDSCTRFDFLSIPNLDSIGVSLTVSDYEKWRPSCDALSAEFMWLPILSPFLHSLQLKLSMSTGRKDTTAPPWAAYTDLLSSINQLRFPALAALELAVDVSVVSPGLEVDFSVILLAHPNLTSLTLSAMGTPMEFIPLLHLRAFTGTLVYCAAVVSRAPDLESLSIWISEDDDIDEETLPTLFPLGVAPTVTLLKVSAVDEDEDDDSCLYALSSRSLECLAGAFPHLTHLEVNLAEKLNAYTSSLVALPRLEYLCLQLNKTIPEKRWNKPETVIFPAAEYAAQISTALLPALVFLADVRLVLRGDRSPNGTGCPSCDEHNDFYAPGPLWAEHRFWVRRTEEGGRVLVLE